MESLLDIRKFKNRFIEKKVSFIKKKNNIQKNKN